MLWTAAIMLVGFASILVDVWCETAYYEACVPGKHFAWNQE